MKKSVFVLLSAVLVFASCGNSGQLSGKFSVGPKKQVRFSSGNLQYNPATETWKFADNQYDVMGLNNKKIEDPNFDGYIDLFGWGTSGAPQIPYGKTRVHCTAPTSTMSTPQSWGDGLYGPLGEGNDFLKLDLTGENSLYDWGFQNPITNGGNKPGLWRTLTYEEWVYLLFERPKAAQLLALGSVSGIYGLFICPDNYNADNVLQTIAESDYKYTEDFPVLGYYYRWGDFALANSFTEKEWKELEKDGIVFLPTAGRRYGKSAGSMNAGGWYWTASHYDVYSLGNDEMYNAKCVRFDGQRVLCDKKKERSDGYAVRLVHDVK